MTRKEILEEAIKCVCETRDQQYGSVQDNFQTISNLWEDYLIARYKYPVFLQADDVGVMMALLKIARIASGQVNMDSFVDACGYLSCAGEIATT